MDGPELPGGNCKEDGTMTIRKGYVWVLCVVVSLAMYAGICAGAAALYWRVVTMP